MRQLRPAEAQWMFPEDALEKTPSREHMTLAEELKARQKVVEDMRGLAHRTGLTGSDTGDCSFAARSVLTVGATLAHRFYMRRSVKDFPVQLIAPTIFFLAAKVEDEPVKLRYITNSCLAKYMGLGQEKHWNPHADGAQEPSEEYRRWEKDILATEELVLEALCFDMVVEQPWSMLRKAVKGLQRVDEAHFNRIGDTLAESSAQAVARKGTNGHLDEHTPVNGKGKGRSTDLEESLCEIGWILINEENCSPLPVLHPGLILAFGTLVVAIALTTPSPLSEALIMASELGWKFGLDIAFDEEMGAVGPDLAEVQAFLRQFLDYTRQGLIDETLENAIPAEPEAPISGPFSRLFPPPPAGVLPVIVEAASNSGNPAVKQPAHSATEDNRTVTPGAEGDDLFGSEGGSPIPSAEVAPTPQPFDDEQSMSPQRY